jgi:hypothetical protein
VDELTDVNQNHWAYEALQDLVENCASAGERRYGFYLLNIEPV